MDLIFYKILSGWRMFKYIKKNGFYHNDVAKFCLIYIHFILTLTLYYDLTNDGSMEIGKIYIKSYVFPFKIWKQMKNDIWELK